MDASRPFGPGSVSLRCYPHLDLDASEIVTEMRAQAALAAEHGFDGVMTSEHHGGFAGYLPNPIQLAGFLLDAMPHGWATACPVIATLRPAALIAEETAWLAARHPERVGVGLAAGALEQDFAVMDLDMHDLTARFTHALERVTELLRGETDDALAGDPAIARCRAHPIPVLSAAASATAARRAARLGAGLILDSLASVARCRELTDAYRAAGGVETVVLVRRVWIGEPPRARFDDQVQVYRGYAAPGATANWGTEEMLVDTDGDALAARVAQTVLDAGADAGNVRIHVPGVDPVAARAQIIRLGDEVVPQVRTTLTAASRSRKFLAVGTNMDEEWLRDWIPSAERLTIASLPGFTLRWHKRSSDGGKLAALRTDDPGDVVWGVVYEVNGLAWQQIDEGQRDHGYREERVTVVDPDGAEHDASVYVARAEMIDDSLRPMRAYRDPIVNAARTNGLPAAYVAALANTPVADS